MENKKGAILDVGANIGIMTAHLSQAFPENTIIAIEPMPENLAVLKEITQKKQLNNVKIVPFAVGAHAAKMTMIMPTDGKAKLQGLSHIKSNEMTEWNVGEECEVEVKTLDEIVGQEKIQGIKMDVENYEFHALVGAEKIIQQNKPIIYTELWNNENRKKCLDWLKKMNYKTHVLVDKKLVPFDEKKHPHQNFFFLPN